MYDLKQLRAAATAACKAAVEAKDTMPNEAVNWADLTCVEAAHVTTDSGDSYYQVSIEEAESNDLCIFIAMRLGEAGFPGVEVDTEW